MRPWRSCGDLDDLGVHLVHHDRALEGVQHTGLVAVTVILQVAGLHALEALVAAPGHDQQVIIPLGPQVDVLLVAEGGVIVAVLAHQVAAGLHGLQPLQLQRQLFQHFLFAHRSGLLY